MTVATAVEFLLSLQHSGIKLGLETMRELCHRLGHPEKAFPSIHIAGTNGKGSTAALVEAALRACGYRTGLYTSPHLIRFSERVRVAGREISDAALAERVAELRPIIEKLQRQGRHPTFFEATTALAFSHFRTERTTIAVIETGMGGRLDSTNVIHPAVTAITSIGYDHMEYLGPTLQAIAAEKAGILKRGVPAVLGTIPDPARAVILQRAHEVKARPVETAPAESPCWDAAQHRTVFTWRGQSWSIPLAGRHQATNAALALDILRTLAGIGWELPAASVRRGLEHAQWPARFEFLSHCPAMVIDGGHNPDGIHRALETWQECHARPPGRILFGCMKDKDAASMLGPITATGAELWLLPVASPRGADPHDLAALAGGSTRVMNFEEAWDAHHSCPHPEGTLLLGSLYLAGQWRARHYHRIHQLDLN